MDPWKGWRLKGCICPFRKDLSNRTITTNTVTKRLTQQDGEANRYKYILTMQKCKTQFEAKQTNLNLLEINEINEERFRNAEHALFPVINGPYWPGR